MYHIAEIVRDAQRDMHERFDSRGPGGLGTWAASYTPFPFLYALSGQIVHSMQRRAPDIVKSAVVRARDQMAESVTSSHRRVLYWRLTCTRTGQHVFYTLKDTVEHAPLPGVVAPLRGYVAVPLFQAVEGFAQFVTSEELPELYFVAKNSMRQHLLLRHLVLPPLGAVEGIVRYVVIFPSQIVFPSREEIEMRTDLFLRVSTTRVQHMVESLYSATEVLDQHWSMVQWNILGRGPYESLSPDRRADVIQSILLRMRTIASKYKLYEFMATIKLQNEMLYADVLAACAPDEFNGTPLTQGQIDVNETLVKNLAIQDEDAFPCWFYRKIETSANSQDALSINASRLSPRRRSSSSGATPSNSKWIEFPPHENRRLERHYRFYHKQKALGRSPLPSSIVLVDEGRHEVCMETMAMTPVYWPALETQIVCRSRWLYAQRNYGLAPYPPSAARVLEQTFTYYLAFHDHEKQLLEAQRAASSSWRAASSYSTTCSLSVPVEGHVVELKGPNDMMQYKRLLAGTTPFTSKRRVYRGDPRITADAKLLATWHRAMKADEQKQRAGRPPKIIPNEDDDDIEQEVEHLVLIVHGIGEALKTIDLINVVTLRSIIDCATSLRQLHREATGSTHFAHGVAEEVNAASPTGSRRQPRVEFLPIEWHSKLHLEELDERIRNVTLPAIPKLREFANETVLDVLFFMSPKFHHVILEQVALEMNRVVALFQTRHPSWAKRKKVSILAHSLGAIISFDILGHQVKPSQSNDISEAMKQRSWSESACTSHKQKQSNAKTPRKHKHRGKITNVPSSLTLPENLRLPPALSFSVENLFCFGSPVGLFLRVRGQQLDASFSLPTCRRVFNIYHPYDPVAYRIEPILNPQRAHSKAAIIRTFEGKLRFQYQVRDAFRVMWQRLRNWRREFEHQVERDVRRFGLVESPTTPPQSAAWPTSFTAEREGENDGNASDDYANGSVTLTDLGSTDILPTPTVVQEPESQEDRDENGNARDESLYGRLCQGLPIDYTLQENEIEVTNEYLFALTAHVIYWTNRDASLFVAQHLLLTPALPDDFDGDATTELNDQTAQDLENDGELGWGTVNGAHPHGINETSRARSRGKSDALSSSSMFVEAGEAGR